LVNDPFARRKELFIITEDGTVFFDISLSPIFDHRLEQVGRILTARDISRFKTLEVNYKTLSGELEGRIQKHTKELHNTAERYRAIVEKQTDFIVCWKPDGTRTFVNEAYCRYWGITYEQALAINFLFHAAAEDRPSVEEKISRLNSGAINIETEVHRVIKPDGSIAWQEWTDQAIRDAGGTLIEIQSVGRDITERRRNEGKI